MSERSDDRRDLSRRAFLAGAGATGLAAGVAWAAPAGATTSGPTLWRQPGSSAAVPEQLHLQFGTRADREMVVSWATPEPVRRPYLLLGGRHGGYGQRVPAVTRTYVDGKSGVEVYTHHAALDRLQPDTAYRYAVGHDGARPVASSFTTAPCGRSPFRFTSFGDQATATDTYGGPFSVEAGLMPSRVEDLQPVFHLLNGDLCYANQANDRVGKWREFFNTNQVSAANRPWMPCAGNHENESGNGGPFTCYQTRFWLPESGGAAEFSGLWYAFTVGSMRVISIQNDDVCIQDFGDTYIRGYSKGAQKAWLERALADARADDDIDWVVICMHQTALSSAHWTGCDLGIRQEFLPLFDKYGVDLVLCGHEHDYERSYPVRGVVPGSATLQPQVADTNSEVIDTSKGAVHMVLGGGGNPGLSNKLFEPNAEVVIDVGPPDPTTGKRPSIFASEPATWSAYRDVDYPYGFASFDLDPGRHPGDLTTIDVTFNWVHQGAPRPVPVQRFRLQRPRRDGRRGRATPTQERITVS